MQPVSFRIMRLSIEGHPHLGRCKQLGNCGITLAFGVQMYYDFLLHLRIAESEVLQMH